MIRKMMKSAAEEKPGSALIHRPGTHRGPTLPSKAWCVPITPGKGHWLDALAEDRQ